MLGCLQSIWARAEVTCRISFAKLTNVHRLWAIAATCNRGWAQGGLCTSRRRASNLGCYIDNEFEKCVAPFRPQHPLRSIHEVFAYDTALAMTSNHDAPPDYCYANWDEVRGRRPRANHQATRSRVGAETFPPTDYCNVSCAYHMGDPVRTYRRIQLAVRDGQRVCAHPGLDTAVNGRHITAEDVYTHVMCV